MCIPYQHLYRIPAIAWLHPAQTIPLWTTENNRNNPIRIYCKKLRMRCETRHIWESWHGSVEFGTTKFSTRHRLPLELADFPGICTGEELADESLKWSPWRFFIVSCTMRGRVCESIAKQKSFDTKHVETWCPVKSTLSSLCTLGSFPITNEKHFWMNGYPVYKC